MQLHRIIRITAVSLGFAAVAAPAAVAQPIDAGPPPAVHQDLSGFYRPAVSHGTQQDKAPDLVLRRDGGGPTVDLRSPDARDAARGVSPHHTAPVATAASKSDDTDWGKIGIIGGSALGALALCALGFVLFTRRTPVLTR